MNLQEIANGIVYLCLQMELMHWFGNTKVRKNTLPPFFML
jgi:hypothetical protein